MAGDEPFTPVKTIAVPHVTDGALLGVAVGVVPTDAVADGVPSGDGWAVEAAVRDGDSEAAADGEGEAPGTRYDVERTKVPVAPFQPVTSTYV